MGLKTRAQFKNALRRAAEKTASAIQSQFGATCCVRETMQDCCKLWQEKWVPVSDRLPPNGGWDWKQIHESASCSREDFTIAIFGSGVLCGFLFLSIANDQIRLRALEGNPDPTHPLKNYVIPIAIEFVIRLAQETGRDFVWLMEPAENLIQIYERVFNFKTIKPKKGAQRCERRVT